MSETETEIRLALLVDNELTAVERAELIEALDQAPHLWRRCAITFMDEQFLKKSLAPKNHSTAKSTEHTNVQGKKPLDFDLQTKTSKSELIAAKKKVHSRIPSRQIGWVTLGLLVGLGVGLLGNASTGLGNRLASQLGWINNVEHGTEATNQDQLLMDSVVSITNLANEAEAIAEEFELPSQSKSVKTKSVRLFEIQNDELRAVYYSPDAIPDFILESMVMAGHEVELTNEKLRTPIGGNQVVNLPIYAMRIEKNPRLVNRP